MDLYLVILFIILLAVVLMLLYKYGYLSAAKALFTGGAQPMRIFTQEPWYTEIEAGRKTVEARVGDAEKYKALVGKVVKIVVPGKKVRMKVVNVRQYKTLEEFLEKEGWKKVAPHVKSENAAKEAYLSIKDKSGQAVYDPARVKEKGGVVALELAPA